ncbi:Similar to Haspin: Serine/threonine-protein kinase haspin homolog (Drosophila melanogaster) [Cotesia congregata]|uniref:non-specific serine/threonine protein kinase n=1 Tax=Cotesia congregata TaxID=51543 RepID=A0A8J2HKH7_COTCN|nr:Similar to Haspin: Serine/threonine-protein kinase haspin homolog (Drosophila melanogaster) [Cotesia congregata]
MFQKPIKTYGRKPKPVTTSGSDLMTFHRQHIISPLSPDSSIDFDKYLDKSENKSSDYDPFETTFDRVVKTAKLPPRASKRELKVRFVDSTTDSGEESYVEDSQKSDPKSRSSSIEKDLEEDKSEENKSLPDNSDLNSKLTDEETLEQSQDCQTPDSRTSDEYLNKPPAVESPDQSLLQPVLDNLESTQLQPSLPQNDLVPQFVDTTTDSNEESFELVKIDQKSHITHRKIRSNSVDNATEKITKSLPVKTRVRKRKIKKIGNDSSDSDASVKFSPVRKSRRGNNRVSRAKAGSLEQTNRIKNCSVMLTRLELKENRLNNNQELKIKPVKNNNNNNNNNDHRSSCLEAEVKSRECIVRLSQLNNNNNNNNKSTMQMDSTLSQTFISSTPCERRVGFKKLKPGISPIYTPNKASKNLTVPPTILLDVSTELFGDEETNMLVSKKLGSAEEETSITSADLFSSFDELQNQSEDSSVVDDTNTKDSQIKIDDESCQTLIAGSLSGQNSQSVNESFKSEEIKSLSDSQSSVINEMDQRSSIDDMVLDEIEEGNFVSEFKSFDNFTEDSNKNSELSNENSETLKLSNKNSEISELSECIENSLPIKINQTCSENISINNDSILVDESKSAIESSVENSKDNELIDSSETDDDYHLVVSNTSSSNKEDNSTEHSSQEEGEESNKKEEIESDSINENKNSVVKLSEPFVLLERLNNIGHVTTRRRDYQSWARNLDAIAENSSDLSNITEKVSESSDLSKKVARRTTRSTKISLPMRRSTRIKSDSNEPDERPKKSRVGFLEPLIDRLDLENDLDARVLYLKPGKSWARSLSILNNIRKEEDLDLMPIGNKGKKWRQSVRNVLSMQRQSVAFACVKNKENEKSESETFHRDRLLLSKRSSNFPKVSLINNHDVESGAGRFARRMSIRVVPNSSKYSIVDDKIIEDSSFLKAYGISTDRNDEIKKKSLAPKESLVYQLRCSSTPTLEILPEPVSARNVVLQRCDQTDSLPFESCYPDSYLKHCRKIGEGVYGEVFLYENKRDKSVIKIIPIEGNELVNGEPQKKYGEILSEIIIAKELHDLRFNKTYQINSFVEVKNIRCIKGKYPDKLLQLWDAYDEKKNSENDSPRMFTDDQLYIALELGNGGQDMEAFVFNNSAEAYITFVQAALALAVAEKSLDFEHRDMHWGNILISRTNEKQMSCKLDSEEISLQCNGIKTTIIDFTLSRMSYQGCCMFNDLALDPALFTAVGEYQFDIYRLMKEKTKNNWQSFEPYTNILWLHYTLDKMVTAVRYKNVTSKTHKQSIEKLEELKNTILEYESAFDFISNCDKLIGLNRSSC